MDSPVEASKNYLFNFDPSVNLLCLVELRGYNSSQISEPEIKYIGVFASSIRKEFSFSPSPVSFRFDFNESKILLREARDVCSLLQKEEWDEIKNKKDVIISRNLARMTLGYARGLLRKVLKCDKESISFLCESIWRSLFQVESILREGIFCENSIFSASIEETISKRCKEVLEIDRQVTWDHINTTINELLKEEKSSTICRSNLDDQILNDWLIKIRLKSIS